MCKNCRGWPRNNDRLNKIKKSLVFFRRECWESWVIFWLFFTPQCIILPCRFTQSNTRDFFSLLMVTEVAPRRIKKWFLFCYVYFNRDLMLWVNVERETKKMPRNSFRVRSSWLWQHVLYIAECPFCVRKTIFVTETAFSSLTRISRNFSSHSNLGLILTKPCMHEVLEWNKIYHRFLNVVVSTFCNLTFIPNSMNWVEIWGTFHTQW